MNDLLLSLRVLGVGALLLLSATGCSDDTTSTGVANGCAVWQPDASAGPTVICDIAWSCESDSAAYGIQCTYNDGNYNCTCMTEGSAGKTFVVNQFTCDTTNAMPAANAGCGWTLTP